VNNVQAASLAADHRTLNPHSQAGSDPLVSALEFRRELGNVSHVTLWRWKQKGLVPAPVRLGGRDFWRRSVLEQLKENGTLEG
jgi:predicted DNA-binding transcriptional regulator AlpA